MASANGDLNGKALKQVLWETLHDLKQKKIDAKVANSVASQSREIMRVMKMELTVLSMAQKKVTAKMLGFVE